MTVLSASVMPSYDTPLPSLNAALRLECWYHGSLTRVRSEYLVRDEGDFLVRVLINNLNKVVLISGPTAFIGQTGRHSLA
ncbi:unnamed protein product [Gongylonema pulchrum]|uniref:SH2 domain-containing protein n=1 Tax=Gongylonema pulchrum TaxID=637853 RepID=A0A183EKH2_9BILA|nr:unnamed protein product [Gongylonema pulchrum]